MDLGAKGDNKQRAIGEGLVTVTLNAHATLQFIAML